MSDEKEKTEDSIVAGIHARREAYAKSFNYDLDAIADDILKRQEERKPQGQVFVSQPPKYAPGKRTGTNN